MRDIAIDSYPMWLENQDTVLHFAKEYLSKQDLIAYKCWNEDMLTASALMQLDDVCHFLIEQLSDMHGQ